MAALVSPENAARNACVARRGASMRRVDETPGDADTKDRRSEGGACSSGGVECPHQRARGCVGVRGTCGRRARTPCRGEEKWRVGEARGTLACHVDEAPDGENAENKEQGRCLLSGVRGCNGARLSGERGAASARGEEGRVDASRRRDARQRGHREQEERGRSLLLERCGKTAPASKGKRGCMRFKRVPRKDPLPRTSDEARQRGARHVGVSRRHGARRRGR